MRGRGEGTLTSLPDDRPGDGGGEPLVTVAADQRDQVGLLPLVEDGGGRRSVLGLIHPHVEGAVAPEAEAAIGVVELIRRGAEIEGDEVAAMIP